MIWDAAKKNYKTQTGKKHKPANWLFGTNIGKILGKIDEALEKKRSYDS